MPEGGVAADDVAGLAILFRLGFSVKFLREVANPLLHHDVDMAHAADPRPPIFGLEHLEDEVGALGVPVAAAVSNSTAEREARIANSKRLLPKVQPPAVVEATPALICSVPTVRRACAPLRHFVCSQPSAQGDRGFRAPARHKVVTVFLKLTTMKVAGTCWVVLRDNGAGKVRRVRWGSSWAAVHRQGPVRRTRPSEDSEHGVEGLNPRKLRAPL